MCLNKYQLRRELQKKSKLQLEKMIDIFRENCPNFSFSSTIKMRTKDQLVSRVWEALLTIQGKEQEYDYCINFIKESSQPKIPQSQEMRKDGFHIGIIKKYPFEADFFCKHTYELLTQDDEFLQIWKMSRHYNGFVEFLCTNNISIPEHLEKLLYDNIFQDKSKKSNFPPQSSIDYGLYNLESWEKDLKKFFHKLDDHEIETVLFLHLIYNFIRIVYERNFELVEYEDRDDIPLLKRVFFAMCVKMLNDGKCEDNAIDQIIGTVGKIYEKTAGINICIEPWIELD